MGARVVIAEDEALIRLDLRETLEEEGYQVVAETSRGDEVVGLVREHRPDLAILDIKMPGGDGLSAAAEITADRLAAVLVLTAFSQRELIDRAREAGALAYLVKPFQRNDLVPAMELAIGRFEEMKALEDENKDLEERLETRKVVDREGQANGRARYERERRVQVGPAPGDGRKDVDEGRRSKGAGREPPTLSCRPERKGPQNVSAIAGALKGCPWSGLPARL